jgi:hypothetical protein
MQHLEVSGAVRHTYIYVIRRVKVTAVMNTEHFTRILKNYLQEYCQLISSVGEIITLHYCHIIDYGTGKQFHLYCTERVKFF